MNRVVIRCCITTLLALTIVFSTISCSLLSKKSEGSSTSQQTTQNGQKGDKSSSQQIEDKDLIEKIKNEKGVRNATVYTQNGVAVAAIATGKEVSKESGKKLADKYSKELKEKYKNNKVTVQVILYGNEFINVNLD